MVVLLILSLSLEIAAGIAAYRSMAGFVLLPVLSAHWLACALFALSAVWYISQNLARVRGRDAALFFSLSFFVPLLGMFGLCAVLPAFRRVWESAAGGRQTYQTIDAIQLPKTPPAQAAVHPVNPDMLVSSLRHAPDSSRRTAAVLATLRMPDQDAINILRVALGDSEDDIRLLAYALLAQMDKRYNDKIQAGVALLGTLPANKRFLLCKQIAQQYWELAWVGLARGESVAPILRKALEYASAGLTESPMDAGLQLLYGKILLRLKRYDEAFDALSSAELCGIDARSMSPYFAEISLSRRHVSSVMSYMEMAKPDMRSSLAVAVRDYWEEKTYAN